MSPINDHSILSSGMPLNRGSVNETLRNHCTGNLRCRYFVMTGRKRKMLFPDKLLPDKNQEIIKLIR